MSSTKTVFQRYFYQLTDGCGNNQCTNVYCRSSSSFKYEDKNFLEDRNRLAAEAIRLFSERVELCVDDDTLNNPKQKIEIKNFTEENLQELINQCKQVNNWDLLRHSIELIFSNRLNLSTSFLRKDFLESAYQNQPSIPSNADAVPKSFFIHDPRITLDNDEITLDVKVMKQSIESLLPYEDEISSVIHQSLGNLLHKLRAELVSTNQNQLETDANFFNLFFIIFEFSFLSDPIFIYDVARLLYWILTNLSLDAQAKFVRLLSKYSNNLSKYISHVQQYITLHTLQWCEHTDITSENAPKLSTEPGIKEGLNILRMLYYANLLSSQRDPDDILEKERENDENMQIELVQRRQQNLEDTDKDKESEKREQQTDSESTSEPLTPSSATVQHNSVPSTPTTTAARRSVTDKADSPFENLLEKKLHLKTNEYRRCQYPFDDFVNEFANDKIDIKQEYVEYIGQRTSGNDFSFIFYPFFLTTINKIALINIENKARMYFQRRSIFVHNIFSAVPINPYFKLYVRRDHLIEDAFDLGMLNKELEYQGIEHPDELKKQLFVEFEGEQGHDEGGLSKEFFQLITHQIFSPEYGMFMTNEETRCLWFNPSAVEDLDREYMLIGMLLGLAIYNSIILDIKFPPVIYRKLIGKIGTFEDLESSHPTIYKNLKNLLTFNEQEENMTVEEAFGLTFQAAISDAMGSQVIFDLKENGDAINVTRENREEFVRLYSDVILNKSIEKQFHPFFHGFLLVTRDSSLRKIFRPDEIDLLVAGSQVLDFNQLALAATYDGSYTKDSPTIQNFWTVLKEFDDEQKRKFLRFTTGSDRAPIGGLLRLKLIISRNGPDTDRLPTAHTCFNVLLLPDYSSTEKLRDKLSLAIDNTEGFGLR